MTAEGGGGAGASEGLLPLDQTLEILSNYQRRAIIQHLRDAPGHIHSIDALLKHLGEIEETRPGETPGENHLLSVLVHVHGPKLEDAGLVDYDLRSREIRYHPTEYVERILENIEAAAEPNDRV